MGNGENEGQLLRKVNIRSNTVSAVSESINISAFGLGQLQDPNQQVNITVASPVMKKLDNLQEIPAQAPDEAVLRTAYDEIGLKVSSSPLKRSKMVAHSAQLHTKQTRLQQLQGAQYAKMQTDNPLQTLLDFDPTTLMYPQERGSSYDKYLAHYADLQEFFLLLPDLKAALDTHESNLPKPLSQADSRMIDEASAKLRTLFDVRAYYKTQEALMSNKYFSYLPQEEVNKLSYRELRLRLDNLYNAVPRNEDLIDYYQNQIRLKEIGLSGEKSVRERKEEYLKATSAPEERQDRRKPKDVIKQIASAYEKLRKKAADKNSIISIDAYKEVFFKCHSDDLDKFIQGVRRPSAAMQTLIDDYNAYKVALAARQAQAADQTQTLLRTRKPKREKVLEESNNPPAGINLTDDQKKAIRSVSAYLLENTDGHDALVYNMVRMRPDLLLLTIYTIEKGTDESVVGLDYLSILSNYQPDPVAISKKKRDWNVISSALRTSMSLSDDIRFYGALTEQTRTVDTQRDDPNAVLSEEEQVQSLTESIIGHGMILRMLYRSAGLHDDMPPDMAQDPVIREKLFAEYKKIVALTGRLAAIDLPDDVPAPDDISGEDYNDEAIKRKVKVKKKDDSSLPTGKAVQDSINKINQIYSGKVLGGIKNLAGSFMSSIPGDIAGGVSFVASNSIAGATAVFGLIAALSNSVSLFRTAGSSTGADIVSKAAGNFGEYTSVAAGGLSVAGSVTNLIQTGNVASTAWLKPASQALWNSTSVGGKLLMWGGITTMVAGSVKMVSSGIQAGRAVSNMKDVTNAKTTIAEKRANREDLTDDEERLELFLSHRERSIKREGASAAMGMVSGAMAVVAGGFAMSGYLAPIGAIVGLASLGIDLIYKGIDYGYKKRNQKKAVDEFLKTDSLVELVKGQAGHPLAAKINSMGDSTLKENIRNEALAMLGYATYEQCFRDICRDMASFLYFKVFVQNPQDDNIGDYENAISSLGFKVKRPLVEGDQPKPSVDAMITKLMS